MSEIRMYKIIIFIKHNVNKKNEKKKNDFFSKTVKKMKTIDLYWRVETSNFLRLSYRHF